MKRCIYCDFVSGEYTPEKAAAYVSALKKEISSIPVDRPLSTLYIGGGTPTMLTADQLSDLTRHIFEHFNFIDDHEVSLQLFKTIEEWAKEKHAVSIHGPLGFTDMDPEGMLIEGFIELGTIATIYNYPYYSFHIERLGFKKDIDWVEFEVTMHNEVPDKIKRIADIALKRNNLKRL